MEIEYGCECRDDCLIHRGDAASAPVAYLVKRHTEFLKVCTRCQLSNDTVVRILVNRDTNAHAFVEYDALGAMCLLLRFQSDEQDKQPETVRRFR